MKDLKYELIFTSKNIKKLNEYLEEIIKYNYDIEKDEIRKIYLEKSIIIYKEILLGTTKSWVDFASNFKDLILFFNE